jgi:putative addiction module antidote
MATVKITSIGNFLGIVLPKAIVAKLRVQVGDTWCLTETAHGVELTPCYSDFAHQMDEAETIMRDHRETLRKLAD